MALSPDEAREEAEQRSPFKAALNRANAGLFQACQAITDATRWGSGEDAIQAKCHALVAVLHPISVDDVMDALEEQADQSETDNLELALSTIMQIAEGRRRQVPATSDPEWEIGPGRVGIVAALTAINEIFSWTMCDLPPTSERPEAVLGPELMFQHTLSRLPVQRLTSLLARLGPKQLEELSTAIPHCCSTLLLVLSAARRRQRLFPVQSTAVVPSSTEGEEEKDEEDDEGGSSTELD